jgi:hypothetical protein
MATTSAKRILLSAFSAFAIIAVNCSDPEQSCRPFEIADEFRLLPGVVEFRGSTAPGSPTGCAEFEELKACASSDGRFLQANVINHSDNPITIRWNEAFMLDEDGQRRELVEYPDPAPRESVSPGRESFIQKLTPEQKRTMKKSGQLLYEDIEPFIPWESGVCLSRDSVVEFHSNEKGVIFELPILLGEEPMEIRFNLLLERVSRAEYYERLRVSGGY